MIATIVLQTVAILVLCVLILVNRGEITDIHERVSGLESDNVRQDIDRVSISTAKELMRMGKEQESINKSQKDTDEALAILFSFLDKFVKMHEEDAQAFSRLQDRHSELVETFNYMTTQVLSALVALNAETGSPLEFSWDGKKITKPSDIQDHLIDIAVNEFAEKLKGDPDADDDDIDWKYT